MSIKNNNSDVVTSRYCIRSPYSRLKINNRVVTLISGTPVVPSSPTFVGTDAQVDDAVGGATSTKTFTVSIGTPSATRLVVFGVGAVCGGSPFTITGVTINGSAATAGPTGGDSYHPVNLYYATVSSGTTATIVVTASLTQITSCSIAVGALDNLSSSTPGTPSATFYAGSQNQPYSMGSITVPAGGFGISLCWADSHSAIVSGNTTIDSVCHAEGTVTSIALSHIGAGTINPSFGNGPGNFASVALLGAPWS